jgi:hypothetical protein
MRVRALVFSTLFFSKEKFPHAIPLAIDEVGLG